MYENGFGVDQNDSTAVKWYRKAAKQGDANARNNLNRLTDKLSNKKSAEL